MQLCVACRGVRVHTASRSFPLIRNLAALSGEVFKQLFILLPQCPLCLLKMISSSTTPTAVLSKIPNTLLLFSSTASHFIPVCSTHLLEPIFIIYIYDRQVYSSESYLSLAPIHYALSALAAEDTKDPLPIPKMS